MLDFRAVVKAELQTDDLEKKLQAIENRKIGLKVEVGQDATKRLVESINRGLKQTKLNVPDLSKQLTDSFNIKDTKVISQVRKYVNRLTAEMANAFDGNRVNGASLTDGFDQAFNGLSQLIARNSGAVKSQMTDFYKSFYDDYKNVKVYISDQMKDAMGSVYDDIAKSGRITRDATNGINLNSVWDEMSSAYPEILNKQLDNDIQQVQEFISAMKAAKTELKQVLRFDDLDIDLQQEINNEAMSGVADIANKLKVQLEQNIGAASDALKAEFIIDVSVNSDKIISDIKQAVQQSSNACSPIDIALEINQEELRSKIQSAIQGISAENIPIEIDENEIRNSVHGAIQNLPLEEILVTVDETELRAEIERVVSNATADITLNIDRNQLENDVRAALAGVDFPIEFNIDENELRNQIRQAVAGLDDLEVEVHINIDNIQNELRQGIQNVPTVDIDFVDRINRAGREGTDIFSAFGNTMRDAFSAYTLANLLERGIDMVVDAGKEAVQTIKDLNDAATDLMMATGSDRSVVKQMINDYRELGNELGSLTLDVSSSADEWLRQGKTEDETTTLIKDSVVLSKVGQLDASDATEYLTSAMNGYKVAVEDVEGIIDKLSAVDLESAYDAGQLAEAMSKTAIGADLAGVSMDRLIGYIATVGETTKKSASTVGNSFQTIFSRMRDIQNGNFKSIGEDGTIEDLSNVEIVLKQMGIQLRSSNDEFRSFQDVLDDIAGSWDTFTSIQQASISEVIAGTRQSENFLAIMKNYDKVRKYTEIAAQSEGTAQAKFQGAYLTSLEAKTNQLKNSLEELAADTITDDMYAGFLDVAKAAADAARETDLINTAFAGLASGGATYALTHIIRLIRNTVAEINNLGGGLTGFTQLLMQHPAALVATGVTAIAGAINLYQAHMEKLVDTAKQAGEEFVENTSGLETYAGKITELKTALDSGTLSEEEAYTAKSQLYEIQSQLIEQYGSMAGGIDLVNDSLESQIGLINELTRAEAQQFLNENAEGNAIIKDNMEKVRKYDLGTFYNSDDENEINAIQQAISDAEAEYGDFIDYISDENGAYVNIALNADASTSRDILNSLMTDLTAIQEEFGSSGLIEDMIGNISDALGDAKTIVEENAASYEKIINAEMIADVKTYGEQAKTASEWLKDYTKAVEDYNTAVATGTPENVSKAARNFAEMENTVGNLLVNTDMSEFVEQFKTARDGLNETAIANRNFRDSLSGDVENSYMKRLADDLKELSLTDVDFKLAYKTDGVQDGEDIIDAILDAAADLGIVTDAANVTESELNTVANMLVELGIIAGETAETVTVAGEDIADAFDTANTSTSDVLSQIETAKSALSSYSAGESVSIDAFTAEGMEDYQSALEYVNGTMRLNAEMVEEITKAKAEEQIAINDVTKAQKQAEYLENASQIEKLRQKIEDNNFATGESVDSIQLQIDSLLESNDAIVNQCGKLDILNASLRESIGTYQAWKNAQNASEAGDMFDDTLVALQQIDDVINNTDSDLYGRVGRDDYQASLDLVIPETIDKEDTDAVNSYLDSIYSMFTYDENGNREGLNIEEFCQQAVDKGLMVLDESGESYQVAGKKTMEDFAEGLNLSLPLVQAMFGEMQEFGGKFDWSDEAVQTIGDLGVTATQAAEALREIPRNENLRINLDVSDIESKEDKISALDATIQEMDGVKSKVGVDVSEIEYANSIIQYCVAQKQQLNEPAVMSVDTSLVQGKVGEAVALLQQFQTAQNELEMQAAVGMDTSEAQANVDALAQQIQGLDANVTAALHIDTTSIDTINASLAEHTVQTLVEYGVNEEAVIGYVPQNKTATVKYGVDSTAVDAYNPSNLTRTVTYNVVTNGSAPSGGTIGVNGTAHVNGTTKSGKASVSGDWGTKKSETTLVGELGREIVVDPRTGRWYSVGDNGAEFVDIPKGSIVFNHVQTEELLKNGYVAARGTALANGTANLSGTAMVTGGIKVSQAKKSTSNNSSSTKSTTKSISNTVTKAVQNTAKSLTKTAKSIADWAKDLFDHIEIKLDNLEKKASSYYDKAQLYIDKGLDSAKNYKNAEKYLQNAINTVNEQINYNKQGEVRYALQAEAAYQQSLKKLNKKNDKTFKSAVSTIKSGGTIDISSYNEKVREAIDEFQKWYDKSQDCKYAIDDLNATLEEYSDELYNLPLEQASAKIEKLSASMDVLNSKTSVATTGGSSIENFADVLDANVSSAHSSLKSANSNVSSKQTSYNKAKSAYNSAVAKENETEATLKSATKTVKKYGGKLGKKRLKQIANGETISTKGLKGKALTAAKAYNKAVQANDKAETTTASAKTAYTNATNALNNAKTAKAQIDAYYNELKKQQEEIRKYENKASYEYANYLAKQGLNNTAQQHQANLTALSQAESNVTTASNTQKSTTNAVTSKANSILNSKYASKLTAAQKNALKAGKSVSTSGVTNKTLLKYLNDYNAKVQAATSAANNLTNAQEALITAQQNATTSAAELASARTEYAKQTFENIQNYYNAVSDYRKTLADQYSTDRSLKEAYGKDLNTFDFQNEIGQLQSQRSLLVEERSKLESQLNSLVSQGYIKQNTEEWYEMKSQIVEIGNEIDNLDMSVMELQDTMRKEVFYQALNKALETAEKLRGSISTIKDIISDEMMFDDDGKLTDFGITALAMDIKEYESNLNSLGTLLKKRDQYIKDFNNGNNSTNYSQKEFNEDMGIITSEIQDMLKDTNSVRQAIIDTIVKQGEVELEAVNKVIDAREKLLQKQKDYYDYDKTLKSQTKDLQLLEQQISALDGMTDAESRAQKARLEAQRQEMQDELDETVRDHVFDLQVQGLDDLKVELQENYDNYVKDLNSNLDTIVSTVKNTTASINGTLNTVNATVKKILNSYGVSGLDITDIGLPKYASGTKYVKKSGWAITQEKGGELILKDGSVLTPLKAGDGVIPNKLTEDLFNLALNYDKIMDNIQQPRIYCPEVVIPDLKDAGRETTIQNHYDSLIKVEGNVDKYVVDDLNKLGQDLLKNRTFMNGTYKYTSQEIWKDIKKSR